MTGPPIKACVAYYPVLDVSHSCPDDWSYDITPFWRDRVCKQDIQEAPQFYRQSSPLFRLQERTPVCPLMILQGDTDCLVPVAHTRTFVRRMKEALPDNLLVYLELRRARHGFDILPSPRSTFTEAGVARFLNHVYRSGHEGQR